MAGRIINAQGRESLADYLIAAIGQSATRSQLVLLYKCAVIAIGKGDKTFPAIEGACQDRAAYLKLAKWPE